MRVPWEVKKKKARLLATYGRPNPSATYFSIERGLLCYSPIEDNLAFTPPAVKLFSLRHDELCSKYHYYTIAAAVEHFRKLDTLLLLSLCLLLSKTSQEKKRTLTCLLL